MWGVVAALVGGLFTLTTSFAKSRSEPRLYRLLTRQVALLEKLPSGSAAYRDMLELTDHTAGNLKTREIARSTRKLNGGNVAAVIFLGVVGGVLGYWLLMWAVASAGTVWYWLALVLLVTVVLFIVGLLIAGVSSIYAPPKGKESSDK
jgi:uncharacterized membrane protein HdeD (DUF308 family)